MAKYTFTGGYSRYYPLSGLFVKPGEVYEFDTAPDADWATDEAPVAAVSAPVVAPPVSEPVPALPDPVATAEALLEANPALAQELIDKVAKNA